MSTTAVMKWRMIGVAALLLLVLTGFVLYQESRSGLIPSNSASNPLATFKQVNTASQKSEDAGSHSAPQGQQGGDQPLKRFNGGIAHYTKGFYDKLRPLVQRKAGARDPELIELIKEIIDPPSENPLTKFSYILVNTPQSREIIKVFNGTVKKGFFVECGALDGERSSNTVILEKSHGWTGLLVEMDPHYYTQILGKARKSWSINACLSPHPYVSELQFKASHGGMGRVSVDKPATDSSVSSTPCFPLESILLAIGQNHVNYFSLDVEGVELNILKTIPFDRLTIDSLSVEYRHGGSNQEMLDYMKSKNYRMHRHIEHSDLSLSLHVKDFIFVRNNLK